VGRHSFGEVSKVLKIAAIVVGVAAVVLSAGTALFGAAAVAGALGVTAGTLATISAVLGVTASVLSVAAGLMAPRPNFAKLAGAGTQLDFTADPTAGEPYIMGNARVGMDIVHQASWGDKNRFLGLVGIMSCAGPVAGYDGFFADNSPIGFIGGNAAGYYANFMYLQTQLGARPEAAALSMVAPDSSTMPDWGATYKLSSLAAAGLILVADVDNGKVFASGTPKMTHQVRGVKVYDPRLDSTNGGSGSQRALNETTYAYNDNPWCHHATFALGRWVNGVRVIGAGLPVESIDWPSHIEAANVSAMNAWGVSGRIMSTDRKWDVLKSIAQAGGGYPIPSGAKLACLVNTPRVSLETIQESDVKGPVSVPQMSMRRDRLNGATPRYREPNQAWEVVSGATVRNSTYLTADGGTTRTKEIDFPLVSNKDQAAQLAGYEVANSRERSPISLELDLYWSQYKMGDCLTLNIPSALLINQKCVIISRELDAASNTVRFEFRTEDDAKHTWALGLTGTSPSTTVGHSPGAGDVGGTDTSAILRASYPKSLRVTSADTGGGHASITLDGGSAGASFVIDYATNPPQDITVPSGTITGLANSTLYYIYADVDGVLDATPTYGATTVYGDAINSAAHPNRIYMQRSITTAAAGGAGTSGGSDGGGYGGGTIGGQIP